ncbi:unnamed protein product [Adineta steineri]|uniref:Uncharacterized protein n=1 Tax=Adineta steineri TaxID=433720 RepID=A0A819DWC8_9BILA|nr:unnamed protein product [Adineta steineri]CAF0876337.1 unnamed protein product [Adineta steineri]CAF3840287.1 unnamed protein product [Adineta steineri]
MRRQPLFSISSQFFDYEDVAMDQKISAFRCSSLMRSIVSFELGDNCILPKLLTSDELFFPQSPHLTHLRITLWSFDDCIRLLSQLGLQLRSFVVNLVFICIREYDTIPQMALIRCPNLKELTITNYRNTPQYDQCILPLLQRLLTVEYLTLFLAIGVGRCAPNHFIDGFHLDSDIISYLPYLREFHFHIRSILPYPHSKLDTIRQSVRRQQQSFDCVLDYFNNNYGQCQIYSLPFIGTRLDFISNRFPIFDDKNTFSNVTTLLLFDDVQPFEDAFFGVIAQALPYLKSLEVINRLEQREKIKTTTNFIEFTQLVTLILSDIHIDYAEQLLYRTHLPHLVELFIHYEPLLAIITEDQQQARVNCSKIELIRILESPDDDDDALKYILNFFPNRFCKTTKKK